MSQQKRERHVFRFDENKVEMNTNQYTNYIDSLMDNNTMHDQAKQTSLTKEEI